MARKKLLHLKSGVVSVDASGNTIPKLPTSDQIELGEIAVNYAEGYETLAIKNSSGDVVPFANAITMMNYVDEAVGNVNEVSVVYSGDTPPTEESEIEIYIDENVTPAEVDVYTQAQTDELIDSRIMVGDSGGTLMVDPSIDLEIEFYSKAQIDTQVAAIYEAIEKLKRDNNLV